MSLAHWHHMDGACLQITELLQCYHPVDNTRFTVVMCSVCAGWRHILEKGINGRVDDMKVSGNCE